MLTTGCVSSHAMSIGHNDQGVAVAIMMTPSSVNLEPELLQGATGYRVCILAETLDLVAGADCLATLSEVPLSILGCALKKLPLLILQEGGMTHPMTVPLVEG